MESLHNEDDEPDAEEVEVFSFDFEAEKNLTKERLQELIFTEMCPFHPEAQEELDARQKGKKYRLVTLGLLTRCGLLFYLEPGASSFTCSRPLLWTIIISFF